MRMGGYTPDFLVRLWRSAWLSMARTLPTSDARGSSSAPTAFITTGSTSSGRRNAAAGSWPVIRVPGSGPSVAGPAAGTAFPSRMGRSRAITCTCPCRCPRNPPSPIPSAGRKAAPPTGPGAGSPESAGAAGDAGSGAGATSRRPPAPSRTDPCLSILTGTSLTPPAPAGSYSLLVCISAEPVLLKLSSRFLAAQTSVP